MALKRGNGIGVRVEKHMIGVDMTDHEKRISDPKTRTQFVIEVDPKVAELIVRRANDNDYTAEDMAAVYLTFGVAAFETDAEKFQLIRMLVSESLHDNDLPLR